MTTKRRILDGYFWAYVIVLIVAMTALTWIDGILESSLLGVTLGVCFILGGQITRSTTGGARPLTEDEAARLREMIGKA